MSQTFRALQHRNARWFYSGLLVSNVGSWLQLTAMSLLVYRLTDSATAVGITWALQFIPMLVLGVWAGAVSDRRDRRRMALATQTGQAVQALALGFIDLAGLASVPVIYTMALVLGLVNTFDNPARRGFVTELVPPVDIPNAMSLNTAVMTGSRIVGPALAALLVGPLGTGWLFVLNGVSFAAIIGALAAIDVNALHTPERAPRGGKPVREAIAHLRSDRVLFVTFVAFGVVSTFGFNYNVVLPKLADLRWGGDHWFGWLLAAISVGSLLGSLATAGRPTVSTWWFLGNGFGAGLSAVVMAWMPHVSLVFVLAVPLGFTGAAFVAGMNALSQQACPAAMRGRILALVAVAFLGSTPIGGPVSGWIGDVISVEWSLASGGLISMAAMLWAWRTVRVL
jgi:MFS family permease